MTPTQRNIAKMLAEKKRRVIAMTINNRGNVQLHNPRCDGLHCTSGSGEVRKLAYGIAGCSLILCRACFDREIERRKSPGTPWNGPILWLETPDWENCEIYHP